MPQGAFTIRSECVGTLSLRPVQRSTAEDYASALRRVLLRDLPGTTARAVRINGTDREYALIPGVVEDGVQIVESLKGVLFSARRVADCRHVSIEVDGPANITAADLATPGVEVINPDHHIATVNEGGRLQLEVEVETGSTNWESPKTPPGAGKVSIAGRASPVDRVRISVDEKAEGSLEIEVVTDGTISPRAAVIEAAGLLAARSAGETMKSLCRCSVEAPVSEAEAGDLPAAVEVGAAGARDLGKAAAELEVPDLVAFCSDSFESFTQSVTAPDRRRDSGLQQLLSAAFSRVDGFEFAGYVLELPEMHPSECVRYGRTYSAELRVTGRKGGSSRAEESVHVGQLPMMTARGTFVVGGVEKVVIASLVEAAGGRKGRENDLAQRRVKAVGDQLAEALEGPLVADVEAGVGEGSYCFTRTASALDRFFGSNPLVQRAETTNPLALLTQLRRVVQRDAGRRPGYQPRALHRSHFGRLCPIDTPEGARIGLNLSLSLLARIDSEGGVTTPFRARDGSVEFLNAREQATATVADLQSGEAYLHRYGGQTLALRDGEIERRSPEGVDYRPVSPLQPLGASAGLIPFLANDDSNRGLMGNNMQKQALPLLNPQRPHVETGLEARIAGDVGAAVVSKSAGVVCKVGPDEVVIEEGERQHSYRLEGFASSPLGSCQRQRASVRPGQTVSVGQLLADGPATDGGNLALGRNVLLGFVSWEGFNYEDAIIVSQRLVEEEAFTSIKVNEFVVKLDEEGDLGAEHLPDADRRNLTSAGVVREGTRVKGGDVLVAMRGRAGSKPDDCLVDASLRLAAGRSGTVIEVEHIRAAGGDPLPAGMSELVRVRVAARQPLMVGDKLANRHGGKGVVALILPEDEMPILPDGRALEMMVSPLGLPSRMNFGQVLDTHAGLAARELNCIIQTPGFNGALAADVEDLLEEANLPRSGMMKLRDGRNGRLFERESTVGYGYYMKLHHLAEDVSRSTSSQGADSGYRIGIMETWALQAHGAAHILKEMSTVQVSAADDTAGATWRALLRGGDLPLASSAEPVGRLVRQLRGLCIDLQLHDDAGNTLAPDSGLESVDETSISFASPESVAGWAGGPDLKTVAQVVAYLDEATEDSTAQIVLSHPVQHPWRTMLSASTDEIPVITRLPVLPRCLRDGPDLDEAYLAVTEANEHGEGELAEGGGQPDRRRHPTPVPHPVFTRQARLVRRRDDGKECGLLGARRHRPGSAAGTG